MGTWTEVLGDWTLEQLVVAHILLDYEQAADEERRKRDEAKRPRR